MFETLSQPDSKEPDVLDPATVRPKRAACLFIAHAHNLILSSPQHSHRTSSRLRTTDLYLYSMHIKTTEMCIKCKETYVENVCTTKIVHCCVSEGSICCGVRLEDDFLGCT